MINTLEAIIYPKNVKKIVFSSKKMGATQKFAPNELIEIITIAN